jgi:DNA-directed RNA polymerase specialized sigma subunit
MVKTTSDSLDDLLDSARQGNEAACNELLGQYLPYLQIMAERLERSETAAAGLLKRGLQRMRQLLAHGESS